MSGDQTHDAGRRHFLVSSALAATVAGTGIPALLAEGDAKAVETRARILIIGAGAAGLGIAARLARALTGAEITVVDRRERHVYQPGLTLVATGFWDSDHVLDRNARYIPRGVTWVRDAVAAFDPSNNRVETAGGEWLDYDFLVIAPGVQLDFDAIEGMSPERIGRDGIGCVYAEPGHAARTWDAAQALIDGGGVALFTRPPGDIKCAGAPLKVMMLLEDAVRGAGNRDRADFHYLPPGEALFSQPEIDAFLQEYLPHSRNIGVEQSHPLSAIDPGRRQATFATPDGPRTLDYDFIHVVPPMSAPEVVRTSDLAWAEGPFRGWLEVDRHTLQHPRYHNVFGAGDVVGTPIGKTAASVKAQSPVVAQNLVAAIQGRELPAGWNGYTSCPLITERGQAMLVEFDFDMNITPSFPFIDPFQPQWLPWFLKHRMLHAAYNAMLRGRV